VGFDRFTLHPQFVKDLAWVNCTHRSVRGPITCNWQRDGDRVTLDLSVPVNSSATLVLPGTGTLTEDGRALPNVQGVEKVSTQAGHMHVTLGSGDYRFVYAR